MPHQVQTIPFAEAIARARKELAASNPAIANWTDDQIVQHVRNTPSLYVGDTRVGNTLRLVRGAMTPTEQATPVVPTPTPERQAFQLGKETTLENIRGDPRRFVQGLLHLGIPTNGQFGTLPAYTPPPAPGPELTPEQAYAVARHELAKQYYSWAGATDQEIMEHLKANPGELAGTFARKRIVEPTPTLAQDQLAWNQRQALAAFLADPRATGTGGGGGAPPGTGLAATPQQVADYLKQQQFVRGLRPENFGTAGYQGPTGGGTGVQTPFAQLYGRHLNYRDFLRMQQGNRQRLGLISSIASFGGQAPEDYYGETQEFAPKGEKVTLQRFRS